jgi:hypothetical protein
MWGNESIAAGAATKSSARSGMLAPSALASTSAFALSGTLASPSRTLAFAAGTLASGTLASALILATTISDPASATDATFATLATAFP